jgi:hypothetical protein
MQDDTDFYGELDTSTGSSRDLKATTMHNPGDASSLELFESFRTNGERSANRDDAVTMVTQTDLSRIARLREICKRWKGPLVVSVFLTDDALFLDETLKESLAKLCSDLTIVSYKYPDQLKERWYPVNKLRNLGIYRVETSHYLMIDIDFLPDQDLQATMKQFIPELNRAKTAGKRNSRHSYP